MSANIEQIKAMLERAGKTNLLHSEKVDLDKERLQLEATVNIEKIDKSLEAEIERFKEKVGCPLYWCDDKEQSEWVSIIARHFAEWQKVQDQKTIELAEDHAMLAGMNKMEQQMLEGAVEHYVIGEIAGHPVGPAIVHYDESLNIGDKVKVIVIKEDEK